MMVDNQVPLPTENMAEPSASIATDLQEVSATPVETPRTPNAATSAENESPTRRVLKRGDLVRAIHRTESRLGRITKCIPSNDDATATNDEQSFRYDVEWVLGGRSSGLTRVELYYTTADAEGMTDDAGRSRRKRKPNAFLQETAMEAAPKKKAATVKKKATATKKKATTATDTTTATGKGKKGKAGEKKVAAGKKEKGETAVSKSAAGQKRKASEITTATTTTTTNTNASKPKKSKAGTEAATAAAAAESTSTYVSLDMFERHRREFERIVTRLEKLDAFGFFNGDPPPEFDEQYYPTPQPPPLLTNHGDVTNSHDGGDKINSTNTLANPTTNGLAPSITTEKIAPAPVPSELSHEITDGTHEPAPTPTDSNQLTLTMNTVYEFAAPLIVTNQPTPAPEETQHHDTDMSIEIQESTAVVDASKNGENVSAQETEVQTANQAKGGAKPSKKSKPQAVVPATFPEHPPFNWKMVRRRMEHGRYVLDREQQEDEERYEQLAPYYKSIGLRRKRPTPKKSKAAVCNNRKKKVNLRVLHPKGVNWELFLKDVTGMCEAALGRETDSTGRSGTISFVANKIKEAAELAFERTGRRHISEMSHADARYKYGTALEASLNHEAAMQGKWRKGAFPERKYERLKQDVVCHGLSELDEMIATYELRTTLPDSFVGLSYAFNDTNQSELWMTSVLSEKSVANRLKNNPEKSQNGADEEQQAALALATDDGVVHAQVKATMQSLLIAVQDRVLTERNVLHQPELRSANWADSVEVKPDVASSTAVESDRGDPELVEQPVWGIDCYTRRNILICLEVDFDADTALTFVEKWLLPAINACPVDLAYNIANAARILEGLPLESELPSEHVDSKSPPSLNRSSESEKGDWSNSLLGRALLNKIKSCGPAWLPCAAKQLRLAFEALGPDFFRVHPKGNGSVVLTQKIEANTLITFYRGEVYPSWRWGEKMDAIEITQQRKGLKPALPDFYNMALERPQSDPRGYGLLFVDASRKAGHGSSLSHSCEPTCEVRVAAVNGELCLAMTTIRALEMGEELTFDYNAVTESLNEYRSAVCLCGHGKCRGSFLHFATADCYQQVLNRNAPIATRFSNLAKSCMKKVMSEEDEKILTSHGFGTASFGAISVDRRKLSCLRNRRGGLDSINIVPIWLRTYVADTLRYIEYERRALPVALLCNHLSKTKAPLPLKENPTSGSAKSEKAKSQSTIVPGIKEKAVEEPGATGAASSHVTCNSESKASADSSKQVEKSDKKKKCTVSRPEPAFIYYCRTMREHFKGVVEQQDTAPDPGLAFCHCVTKAAGAAWKSLSEEEKAEWKERSLQDWLSRGGENAPPSKGQQERSNSKAKKAKATSDSIIEAESGPPSKGQQERPNAKGKQAKPISDSKKGEGKNGFGTSDISFEAADAEGLSAMEQRIQQLTQTLSRVGRVLDRHRQSICASESLDDPSRRSSVYLRDRVHAPLLVLRDEHVVAWIWNNHDGVVRTLLRCIDNQNVVNPSLKEAIRAVDEKYGSLAQFGIVDFQLHLTAKDFPVAPSTGRNMLNEALEALRLLLLREADAIGFEWRRYKGRLRRDAALKRKWEASKVESPLDSLEVASVLGNPTSESDDVFSVVSSVLRSIVDKVVEQIGEPKGSENASSEDCSGTVGDTVSASDQEETKLLEQYHQRFRLQATADLLLMYQRTGTFFAANHYKPLESTPIEVYARELGNSVPKSAIDHSAITESKRNPTEPQGFRESCGNDTVEPENCVSKAADEGRQSCSPVTISSSTTKLCNPDDIIANVSVRYEGDYVLSQLLQWYNGGIGQKQGLPDLLGCVVLPAMAGCWEDDASKPKSGRSTQYELQIRPKLKEWFENPHKRGSPFPHEIQRVFKAPSPTLWSPFGSPVLDFLVTGDESNIHAVLQSLNVKDQVKEGSSSPEEGLLSTVDQGMPAQAVANWVQCENPNCLKWRKLPWHVDVDMLPEKFFCKDNKWNPALSSCETPEEEWSERDAQIKNDGVETLSCPIECDSPAQRPPREAPPSSDAHYAVGARLDVLRTGKSNYCVAIVVEYDGMGKRVKFHYPKTKSSCDEWIEVGSPRIAPLNSKVIEPDKAKKVNQVASKYVPSNAKAKKAKPAKGKGSVDSSLVLKAPQSETAQQTAGLAKSEDVPNEHESNLSRAFDSCLVSSIPNDATATSQTALAKNESETMEHDLSKPEPEIARADGRGVESIAGSAESGERNSDWRIEEKPSIVGSAGILGREKNQSSNDNANDTKLKSPDERYTLTGTECAIEQDNAEPTIKIHRFKKGKVTGDRERKRSASKSPPVNAVKFNHPESHHKANGSMVATNHQGSGSVPDVCREEGASKPSIPESAQSHNSTILKRLAKELGSDASVNNIDFTGEKQATPLIVASSKRPGIESGLPAERKGAPFNTSIPRKRFREDSNPFVDVVTTNTFLAPCKPATQRIPRKTFHGQEASNELYLPRPTPQTTPASASYLPDLSQRSSGNTDVTPRWNGRVSGPQCQLPLERSVHPFVGFSVSGPSSDSLQLTQLANNQIIFRGNMAQRFQPAPQKPPPPPRNFPWPNRQNHGR